MRLAFQGTSAGLALFMLFGALTPRSLVAQGDSFTPETREQMKASAALRPPDSSHSPKGIEGGSARADSTYNWSAAWIGLGVGAVVGAAVGLGAAESAEIPTEGGMVLGALLFGIFGFFVGYAIGNHD